MKKNILRFPLIAIASGFISLTSCSPYAMKWHIISSEEANRIKNSILEKQKEESFKFPELCNLYYYYSYYQANRTLLAYFTGTLSLNLEKNYLKIITYNMIPDTSNETGYEFIIHVEYNVIGKDGKGYRYIPSKDEKEIICEGKDFKAYINNYLTKGEDKIFFELIKGNVFDKKFVPTQLESNHVLENLDDYVARSNKISNENKDSKTIYSSYYFQSQEGNSIEYNEESVAPEKYFGTTLNAKEVNKYINFKFVDNYLTYLDYSLCFSLDDDKEANFALGLTYDKTVNIDKVVI